MTLFKNNKVANVNAVEWTLRSEIVLLVNIAGMRNFPYHGFAKWLRQSDCLTKSLDTDI